VNYKEVVNEIYSKINKMYEINVPAPQ